MRTTRDCSLKGIILRKTNYRNSSLLLELFCEQTGKITVLGKGIRSEENQYYSLMEIGNELDLLLNKSETDLYFFRQGELISAHLFSLPYEQTLPYFAAIELYLQLMIPQNEAPFFYQLLRDYFLYLNRVSQNGVVIFWRFLLKIFQLFGIPFNWKECCKCGSTLQNHTAFSPSLSGFLCSDCSRTGQFDFYFLQPEENDILQKLPNIGNYLSKLNITPTAVRNINQLFLFYLNENFHQTFHINSLQSLYKN
jgi:DNA repair protein RecO (recombination protein O)